MDLIRNTLKFTKDKIHYYECRKTSSHQGEKLNYVCLDKECPNIGILCSICKSELHTHKENIIPLKSLIEQIKEIKNRKQNQNYQKSFEFYMESLQNNKKIVLYQLKNTVQKLANIFMQIENSILKSYQKAKHNLFQQVSKNLHLQTSIQKIISSSKHSHQEFEYHIKSIVSRSQLNGKKQQIIFKNAYENTLQNYQNQYIDVIQKLNDILITTQNILQDKTDKSTANQFLKFPKKQKNHKSTTIFGELFDQQENSDWQDQASSPTKKQNNKYTFSTLSKGESIAVQNEKFAKQNKNGSSSRFVTVNQLIGVRQQHIAFRVVKLKNWVGIGICIRQVVAKANFRFKYEKIGHGSFLLSTNGYTWSHSSAEDNIKNRQFTFGEGQIIDIFLTENELKFVKRQNKKQMKLKIQLKPSEWTSVCFCANLCSQSDEVQIIS